MAAPSFSQRFRGQPRRGADLPTALCWTHWVREAAVAQGETQRESSGAGDFSPSVETVWACLELNGDTHHQCCGDFWSTHKIEKWRAANKGVQINTTNITDMARQKQRNLWQHLRIYTSENEDSWLADVHCKKWDKNTWIKQDKPWDKKNRSLLRLVLWWSTPGAHRSREFHGHPWGLDHNWATVNHDSRYIKGDLHRSPYTWTIYV